MAKSTYGFATTIPYGENLWEVTGVEYCEWEDILERIGNDPNAIEWATYDFLVDKGYVGQVDKPTAPRPEPTKPTEPPRFDDGLDDAVSRTVSGFNREPHWTQSKILAERDKLLREREKIQTLKEKALKQKILEQQVYDMVVQKQSTTKQVDVDPIGLAIGLFVVGILILAAMLTTVR